MGMSDLHADGVTDLGRYHSIKGNQKFLSALGLKPSQVKFQTFTRRKRNKDGQLLKGFSPESLEKALQENTENGWDIGVVMPKGHPVLSADLDHGEPPHGWPRTVQGTVLEPTILIETSPGKLHAHLLIADYKHDQSLAPLSTMLAAWRVATGGDANAKGLGRVWRCPATMNHGNPGDDTSASPNTWKTKPCETKFFGGTFKSISHELLSEWAVGYMAENPEKFDRQKLRREMTKSTSNAGLSRPMQSSADALADVGGERASYGRAGDLAATKYVLQFIPADNEFIWKQVLWAMVNEFGNEAAFADPALDAFDAWSKSCPEKYPGRDDVEKKWFSVTPRQHGVGLGTVFDMVRERIDISALRKRWPSSERFLDTGDQERPGRLKGWIKIDRAIWQDDRFNGLSLGAKLALFYFMMRCDPFLGDNTQIVVSERDGAAHLLCDRKTFRNYIEELTGHGHIVRQTRGSFRGGKSNPASTYRVLAARTGEYCPVKKQRPNDPEIVYGDSKHYFDPRDTARAESAPTQGINRKHRAQRGKKFSKAAGQKFPPVRAKVPPTQRDKILQSKTG